MKRYAMGFWKGGPAMFEQPEGEYVKWADVQALEQRVAELEAALRRLQCDVGVSVEAHDIIAKVIGTPQRPVGVAVPAPARYPDHTAFCCGSAHNCRQPEKSCAMRGDVLGREHERGRAAGVPVVEVWRDPDTGKTTPKPAPINPLQARAASGVSRPDHQTFSQQTPTGPENDKA